MFRDVSSLLQDAVGFGSSIDMLAKRYAAMEIDKVVGIEARGFIEWRKNY